MSQVERLSTAVQEQTTAINQMQSRVAEDVQTLRDQLQNALTEKPELNEVLNRIEANTSAIGGIDPVVQEVVNSGEVSDTTTDDGSNAYGTDTPGQQPPVEGVPSEDEGPSQPVDAQDGTAPGAPNEN